MSDSLQHGLAAERISQGLDASLKSYLQMLRKNR